MTIDFWQLKQRSLDYLLERYDHVKFHLQESQYHGVYASFYWDTAHLNGLQYASGWDPDNEHFALANAIAKLCILEPDLREELYPRPK